MMVSAETTYTVTTFAGVANTYGTTDGTGTSALFKSPEGLCWAPDGNIWVADRANNAIRRITTDGVVSTIVAPSTGTAGTFYAPWQGAFSPAGDYYVADKGNGRIRKVTTDGIVTTFATGLNNPMSLVFDTQGNMYVSERDAKIISKITPEGVKTTYAELGSFKPNCAVFDSKGNLLVGGNSAYTIISVSPDGTITTIAGDGSVATAYNDGTPGNPLTAEVGQIFGLDIDQNGVLYIPDYLFHVIRTLTPDAAGDYTKGTMKTIIGNGTAGFADGSDQNASLTSPMCILLNSNHTTFYIGESSHIIRKVEINKLETGTIDSPSDAVGIYPNPASDFITVSGNKAKNVELFNILGCKVSQTYGNQISLAGVPAGVYTVKVDDKYLQKLVIK
jgi:Secretion system C-terminal sorting domain/NHL repeat